MNRVEFTVPSDPRAMRHVNEAAVFALDAALSSALPGGHVMHGIDPRRILTFAAGGPPVWSVAVASRGADHQFLTYGLSRVVDPSAPFDFELAMRVHDPDPSPTWPMLLLRSIARYHVGTGRQITPGQFMDLGGPISQVPVNPAERHLMPTTSKTSVMVLAGPTLPTPAGPISFRNVIGLDMAERELLESCRAATFVSALTAKNPSYVVSLAAPSLADDVEFRGTIEAAAKSEGSDCKVVCVPVKEGQRAEWTLRY
jgi:hypothetical protein